MSSTVEASVFMWKNYSDNLHSIKNTWKNLTLKQMFDISEKLIVGQSDEIFGVTQISSESSRRKQLVISGQWWRSHQSLACKGLCILRFCVMSWKGESEPNIKYCLGTTVGLVQRFTTIQNFGHNWRRTDGIRVEYFPGSITLQLVQEVQKFMNKMSDPEQFQGRIIFMSMFNDIIWWIKDNEQECIANATLVSVFAKRFSPGKWSFLGPGSEIKWYSTNKERPGGEWDRVDDQIRRKRTPSFPSNESILSRNAQKQRRWKIIYTLLCQLPTR